MQTRQVRRTIAEQGPLVTEPVFTVATPTYNRAETLPRVYESLCAQSFRSFEWLVVDDGSTDHTRDLVRRWQDVSPFPVRYRWQSNQHKKIAVNHAVREARGSFIAILDSDDSFLPDALRDMYEAWENIPAADRDGFAGVSALVMRPDGTIVGDAFPQDPLDTDGMTCHYIMGVRGEKFTMQRTDVMRQFPFPAFVSGLVPENHVWDRIALTYRMRHINKIVRIYYPTEGSLINGNAAQRAKADYDGCLYASTTFLDEIAPKLGLQAPRVIFDTCRQHSRFVLHMLRQGRVVRWWPSRASSWMLLLLHLPIGLALFGKDMLATLSRRTQP
jgi:glycosyltransferase involved in cell wall biosynthesis